MACAGGSFGPGTAGAGRCGPGARDWHAGASRALSRCWWRAEPASARELTCYLTRDACYLMRDAWCGFKITHHRRTLSPWEKPMTLLNPQPMPAAPDAALPPPLPRVDPIT